MQIFKQQNTAKMHFFDYSLWNHYVNVHLSRFCSPETGYPCVFILFFFLRPLSRILIPVFFFPFLLCTFCTFGTFKLPFDFFCRYAQKTATL